MNKIAGCIASLVTSGLGGVVRFLKVMDEQNAGFADALLAETARSRGEDHSSFDQGYYRLDVKLDEPGGDRNQAPAVVRPRQPD